MPNDKNKGEEIKVNQTQKTQTIASDDVYELNDDNSTEETEVDRLRAKLAKSEKEHLYLRAEFDNFRKQAIKERSELLKFGGEPLARDLLNVRDIFQKALESEVTPENFKAFLSGVEMTEKEFSSVFKKHGISEIECKGKAFDPEQAEALGQVPTSDVSEGDVFDVMRKGYLYHDKVLRHAQVIIATKPS